MLSRRFRSARARGTSVFVRFSPYRPGGPSRSRGRCARRSPGCSSSCSARETPSRWSYLGSPRRSSPRPRPPRSLWFGRREAPSVCLRHRAISRARAAKARPAPACWGVLHGATAPSSMKILADLLPPFVSAVETREGLARCRSSSPKRSSPSWETRSRSAAASSSPGARAHARRSRDWAFRPRRSAAGRRANRSGLAGSRRQHHALRGLPGVRGSSLELGAHARDRRRAERPTSRGSLGGGGRAEVSVKLRGGGCRRRMPPGRRAVQRPRRRSSKPGIRWPAAGSRSVTPRVQTTAPGAFTARLLVPGPEVSGVPLRDLACRWAVGWLMSSSRPCSSHTSGRARNRLTRRGSPPKTPDLFRALHN